MALPNNIYVNPALPGNSGTGTIGDPYSNTPYALLTAPQNANGDIFNIKTGADDVLVASLNIAGDYGTPSAAQPLGFRGYTAVAGDGGIGGISGGGSVSVIDNSSLDYITFQDMHLHNSGGNDILVLDDYITVRNCQIDNTTGLGLNLDNSARVMNCYILNCDGIFIEDRGGYVGWNTFEYITNQFTSAISVGYSNVVHANSIDMVSGVGIYVRDGNNVIENNSIFSVAGTGSGIRVAGSRYGDVVLSNIIEGFSGVGGKGIEIQAGSVLQMYGFNIFYNNTTHLSNLGDILDDLSANDQILLTSPYTNAATDDYTIIAAIEAAAYPIANYPSLAIRSYTDPGAFQKEAAGGGLLVHPGMAGGMRG